MPPVSPDPAPLLEGIFSSRVRVKVLTLLITGEAGRVHARELAKITGEHFNAVWQELKHLESLGILRSERVGNHVDYLPNRDLPLLPELRQLLNRAAGREPAAAPPEPTLPVPPEPPATVVEPAVIAVPARRYPRGDPALVFGETD
jgi:hypothetical protein